MADTTFFNRLKKLFSTKAIVTVDASGKRKVFDADEKQQTNLSSLKDRYTKIQKSFYEQAGGAQSMAYAQVRREVFRDFDAMDQDPIIASALDIYADESTLKNEFGDILTIRSDNQRVQELLENLFYDILNVEFNLWPWTRNMCKYGDFFLGLEIAEGKGIVNVTPHSQYNTERIEGHDPENTSLVKFKVQEDPIGKVEYDNFEMAHFRLLSDTNWLPYGKSMIENGRRLWKQLSLMEDAMLIHRIMRAPEKRVFKIDIGNIPPTEVDNYMQKIINKMKKVPFLDKTSGDYNLKYNMQNLTEDFYLPVRGGDSGTAIENLAGLEYASIEDIDYLKAKLFAALKIPKAYLGYDENVNGKATLAAEDVRFARTIERIQRTITSELSKIAVIHLYGNGIQDSEMTNFEIGLVNPSTIYEQEKVNLWSEKIRLATDMQSLKMLSKDWIYENIFKLSETEQTEQRGKIVEDLKDTFRYNSIENDGNDPANPPKQNDVEESLENLKTELKDKGGRPREGNTYGKDKHPYGRDPLGDDERTSKRSRTSETKAMNYINGISSKKKYLHETKDMLDETNIIDDTEN
jgi:dGTP triphosphohydrolase